MDAHVELPPGSSTEECAYLYPSEKLERLGIVPVVNALLNPDDKSMEDKGQGRSSHGIPGLIQLFGIESPGLTSSLAIARFVGDLVADERKG
ncbi:hypothetical protein AXG93_3506s1170 [Marchantia polymorpha subsp. ruderalis]|uniref:FAD dependent oxidoreductase domain-containing protein n=1 Tax=Marchantia polymorpha subsp. ruderalis TaxID=1480154 RepID=A0A176VLZ3_MARPO|nr:hypothetical protein AXG93_3506s1170 [Marchantia polymorpha subsp. ruderalis]